MRTATNRDCRLTRRRSSLEQRFAYLVCLCLLSLAGCATPARDSTLAAPRIDSRHASVGHDSRVRYVILHFTQENFERSLDILTRGRVSSHYLISDTTVPRSYRLVSEDRRAWHAGESYWRGETALNASSIGIEIVNLGPDATSGGFAPFPASQIDELIRLLRDIVRRHAIAPHRILGHSDIAPQRKADPGPQFPWRRLFEAGLVPWPDEQRVAEQLPAYAADLPDPEWFQARLRDYGFQVSRSGAFDAETRRVLANFQAKYHPARHDGEPDAQTAAILAVLGEPEGRLLRQADGSTTIYRVRPR